MLPTEDDFAGDDYVQGTPPPPLQMPVTKKARLSQPPPPSQPSQPPPPPTQQPRRPVQPVQPVQRRPPPPPESSPDNSDDGVLSDDFDEAGESGDDDEEAASSDDDGDEIEDDDDDEPPPSRAPPAAAAKKAAAAKPPPQQPRGRKPNAGNKQSEAVLTKRLKTLCKSIKSRLTANRHEMLLEGLNALFDCITSEVAMATIDDALSNRSTVNQVRFDSDGVFVPAGPVSPELASILARYKNLDNVDSFMLQINTWLSNLYSGSKTDQDVSSFDVAFTDDMSSIELYFQTDVEDD